MDTIGGIGLGWAILSLGVCGPSAASEPGAAASRGLHIACEGMITADLVGQDVIYQGESTFAWGGLGIRVDGQLRMFAGVLLRRTPANKARAQVAIESITANGAIVVEWTDGDVRREVRGSRLVIVPAKADGAAGKVVLGGTTGADGAPAGGTLVWDEARRHWQPVRRPSTDSKGGSPTAPAATTDPARPPVADAAQARPQGATTRPLTP